MIVPSLFLWRHKNRCYRIGMYCRDVRQAGSGIVLRVLLAMLVIMLASIIVIPALAVRGWDFFFSAGQQGRSGENITIRVYLVDQDQTVTMDLEEYVKGVVAAEMPAEFALEALKAQAVAARTYAVKQMAAFGGPGLSGHPGADVSTAPQYGQAWLSETQLRQRWGPFNYYRYWQKISQAVEATRGLVITYQGEPINAVFHSTSGERTADAREVWGTDVPYLKSVPCHWDQQSPRYRDAKEYTLAELEEKLGPETGVLAAARSGNGTWAQVISYTSSGRVDKIRLGTKTFAGTQVRERLGLRSANFTWELVGDKVVFHTIGYGHGVGLCQYGANGMAKEGRTYQEILKYYYTGVAIQPLTG